MQVLDFVRKVCSSDTKLGFSLYELYAIVAQETDPDGPPTDPPTMRYDKLKVRDIVVDDRTKQVTLLLEELR